MKSKKHQKKMFSKIMKTIKKGSYYVYYMLGIRSSTKSLQSTLFQNPRGYVKWVWWTDIQTESFESSVGYFNISIQWHNDTVVVFILYPYSDKRKDRQSNIPLGLKEFPRAKPEGTPEGESVYLTVYPKSSPISDSILF